MRSERKKRQMFLAVFMVLLMIINLLRGANLSLVRADEAQTWGFQKNGILSGNDRIKLTETALENTYSDGKFDVKLEVEGIVKHVTNSQKLDVVLVVDRSNSMKKNKRLEKIQPPL